MASSEIQAVDRERLQISIRNLSRKKSALKGVATRLIHEYEAKINPSKIEMESLIQNLTRYRIEIISLDGEMIGIHDEIEDLGGEAYANLLHDNDVYLSGLN